MQHKVFKKLKGHYVRSEYTPKHIVAGDTDSAIISLSSVFPNKNTAIDDVVTFSNDVAVCVNNAIPDFVQCIFNVPQNRTKLIQTKRETVSDKSLFVAKKNYILHIVDKEGIRKESTKYVGVEIKKSNTPKIIQDFLMSLVDMLLNHCDYHTVSSFISDFKEKYYSLPATDIGNPTTIKNLTKFEDKLEEQGNLKGFSQHAKGSIIYNDICSKSDKKIYAGTKIKLIYVLSEQKYGCIAFPADTQNTPECIKAMEIDYNSMWETVQKKIDRFLLPAKLDRGSRQKQKIKGMVAF